MKTKHILLAAVLAVTSAIQAVTAERKLPAPLPEFKSVEQLAKWRQEKTAAAVQPQSTLPISNFALKNANAFFTGKPFVEETGSYVFKYRNYDPELSRWTTADPSGFPDGANQSVYAAVPNAQIDPDGRAVYTQQLFWHWLGGSGSTVNLPYDAFDPESTFKNLVTNQWKSENMGTLRSAGFSAGFGLSEASINSQNVVISGYTAEEPGISNYFLHALLHSPVSISKQYTGNGSEWSCNLSFNLTLLAIDTFNFNPGESFGPYGVLQDDWFIAYQNRTGIPQNFTVVAQSTSSGSLSFVAE